MYIAGESYAGVYVPYLVYQIDLYNNNTAAGDWQFNLKGMIVGNGVTNWKWDGDTSYVQIGFYHGLYGMTLQGEMEANNCNYYYEDINPDDTETCTNLLN